MVEPSRRLRAIMVPEFHVLDWFVVASGQMPQRLRVPKLILPEDAVLVGVHTDWSSREFAFIVQSELFDEVPLGTEMPREHLTAAGWWDVNLESPSTKEQE